MKVELNDKVTRLLVQDYVNQICSYHSEEELNFAVHKLIHTFTVVEMAQLLIKESKTKLSDKQKKQIFYAALLHDWGRCHEFKNGQHIQGIDHGKLGADLIKKHFPKMKVEIQSTLFHNKCPSVKDPKTAQPVLDYVRDADMLANMQYEIEHLDVFLMHIVGKKIKKSSTIIIDEEIINSVQEKRPLVISNIKKHNLLTQFLWQLCWCFNLHTESARKIAHREKLFVQFRDMICQRILPMVTSDGKIQRKLIQSIQQIFTDTLFGL